VLYPPRIELEGFDKVTEDDRQQTMLDMIEANLIGFNVRWLHLYRAPALYTPGLVRFLREPRGQDNWQNIPRTLQLRTGDCEDLVGWRVAELRASGEDPGARPRVQRFDEGGDVEYHFTLFRSNGQIEDPSRRLGMP
jgi:hypothetical protein